MNQEDRSIPSAVTLGRRTPTFSYETVPAGLLGVHHTTTWAELVVLTGSVLFRERSTDWSSTATADKSVVIVPNRRHHIEPSNDAEFYVQFYDCVPN